MARALIRAALATAVVGICGMAPAQEPVLPSPRPLRTEVVGPISYIRPDPMAVWQNYAVDRQGHWRPRVAPIYGKFRYVGTGEPYPWWPSHPGWVTPMAGNPATFDGPGPAPLVWLAPPPVQRWAPMPYAED
jgi:hypothetical protein